MKENPILQRNFRKGCASRKSSLSLQSEIANARANALKNSALKVCRFQNSALPLRRSKVSDPITLSSVSQSLTYSVGHFLCSIGNIIGGCLLRKNGMLFGVNTNLTASAIWQSLFPMPKTVLSCSKMNEKRNSALLLQRYKLMVVTIMTGGIIRSTNFGRAFLCSIGNLIGVCLLRKNVSPSMGHHLVATQYGTRFFCAYNVLKCYKMNETTNNNQFAPYYQRRSLRNPLLSKGGAL